MAGEQHPEWLPVDWKVDEKRSFGRKRKVTIERTADERLPVGWLKEIRTRRSCGKMRKDAFYFEPVTGREFSSMAAVLRYLEAKDSEKVESEEGDVDHVSAEQEDHSQSSTTEAKGKSLIENKGDKEFTEEKTAESEPRPTNEGTENSIQQNEQQDISAEDYLTEPCIDIPVEPPKEEIQMDRSGPTPAAGSSSGLPPKEFFTIPWFSPAYKLIIDEIHVETYIQLASQRPLKSQ